MKLPEDKELHRIATTCIVYNKKGEFLITKRAAHKKVHPNKWVVPGGGMSIDDYINTKETYKGQWYNSVINTLKRELLEEVNIKIGKANYLLDLTFLRPDGIPVLVLSYYAPFLSGKIKLDEDTVDYAWVNIKDIKKYDLIEGIPDELRMVDKILKNNKK